MDVTSTSASTSADSLLGITPKHLKRLERGLSSANTKGVEYNFDKPPYSDCLGLWNSCPIASQRLYAHANYNNRQRKAAQNPRQWAYDSKDGAALARSKMWLPSDGHRQKPRLERQEAFRVPEILYRSDVVENDADLYRMGLLYDNEHVRGSGFNLNTIVRSDLVFNIGPAKRTRKNSDAECVRGENEGDEDGSLIIAQYSASNFEAPSILEEHAEQPHYPTPARTPFNIIHELNDDTSYSFTQPSFVDLFPERIDPREDVVSDEEDIDCEWDFFDLNRAYSEICATSDDIEDDVGTATEAWIVLSET